MDLVGGVGGAAWNITIDGYEFYFKIIAGLFRWPDSPYYVRGRFKRVTMPSSPSTQEDAKAQDASLS